MDTKQITIKEERDKEFIKKHQGKHFCECSCGSEIIIIPCHRCIGIPKYVQRHYWKTKKAKEKATEYNNKPEIKKANIKQSIEYQNRPEVKKANSEFNFEFQNRPEVKEATIEFMTEFQNRPEVKEETSKWSKEYNSKPGVKETQSKFASEFQNRPEVKEATAKCIIKLWEKLTIKEKEKMLKKTKNTNIKNGRWLSDKLLLPFELYCREVAKETRQHLKLLKENWNGYCYYTKRFILNEPKWSKYEPTVDHKISIFYGFINNMPPKIIGRYDNLCICSRSVNGKKEKKNESEFKENFKKEMNLVGNIK